VLDIKLTAVLLGLMVMLLAGTYAATVTSAQGPFFHHRNVGETGKGTKWSQQIAGRPPWEAVEGAGPEAKLEAKILSEPAVITVESVEVKGIIFNNALQGQAKFKFTYNEPKLVKPALHCKVVIGTNDVVKLYGHQAWTWNGTEAQLKEQPQKEQKPDWIFLPAELQQGAEALPTSLVFTQITLQNKSATETCPIAGQFPVAGSTAATIEPANVEEWGTTETLKNLPNGAEQHFWNGKTNIGAGVGLKFGSETEKIIQEIKIKTIGTQGFAAQEIAHFED
jgi:hypothetical protein